MERESALIPPLSSAAGKPAPSVTIRSRLLMLVLAVLLPGLLGVAWLVGSTFDAERAANERLLRDTSRALTQLVAAEFKERTAIARILARSRWLDDGADATPDKVVAFADVVHGALTGIDGWLELVAPDGRTLLDTRASAGSSAPVQAPAPPAALAEAPVLSPLQITSSAGDAHAAVVYPVWRNGRVVLNIRIALLPQELQKLLQAQPLPPGWIVTILDSRKVVVARSPGGASFVGRAAQADVSQRLAAGREGLYESVTDGVPLIGYYSTGESGWTSTIRMPNEHFAGFVPQAAVRVAIYSLLLLALAVGGAFVVSRGIVAPVQSLKDIALQMQAGETIEARPTGIAEFDAVAAALHEAAESLQFHRNELERQVDEAVDRTRQTEQRASQSQRVEALGRLTGGVAHDFNNLLGVINNSAHLIQRHARSPEIEMPIAATLRAVETGSRLTQHLLRFAGRQSVRPQWLLLNQYLPDLADLLHSVLGRRIELSVKVADDIRPVRLDAAELELALVNLALNARDAMPQGGELQVRARNAKAEGVEGLPVAPASETLQYVLITVSDNGRGLDAGQAERAFEPFFTTKPPGQGSGLGLSQVHGFCTQAGGTARLASTPGLGTTVSLFVPVWQGSAAEANAAAPSAPTAPMRDFAGKRILIVDDNDELGRVTAALLRAHGAEVERAHDGHEALRLAEGQARYDVVLSDVVMPAGMDGIALARQLLAEHPALPVVLISGFNTEADPAEFRLLRKPTSETELVQALHEAIEKAAATRAPAISARPEPV